MRILTRYILLEVIKVFLIALVALTAMLLVLGVVREAVSQGLGPVQVLRLVPFLLPEVLRLTVPGTILFAACSVYGRMAADNEVVAVKSLGIAPWPLVWPTLVLAFLLSLLAVWINDLAAHWGRNGARRVAIEAVEEIAYGMLRSQRTYATNKFSISVRGVQGRRLIQPTLTFAPSGSAPPITIRAQEAELRLDAANSELIITCRNGTMDFGAQGSFDFPDTIERQIPLEDASRARDGLTPSWMPLRSIPREASQHRQELQQQQQEMALLAAYQMFLADFDALTSEEWETLDRTLRRSRTHLHRLEVEPHRRWANGFSCLGFVLVGIPMAVRLRNAGVWSTFFACFLPILVVYYPLLMMGVDLAKQGRLPAYSVWVGNGLLALWGLWLLRRVSRY